MSDSEKTTTVPFLVQIRRRILSKIYYGRIFHTVELYLSETPNIYARNIARLFRTIFITLTLLISPLIIFILILLKFKQLISFWRSFSGINTIQKIKESPTSEKSRVVIIVNDWPKCGSTLVYNSQIRAFAEIGWHVDLVVFSEHKLHLPIMEFFDSLKSRISRVLDVEKTGSILVVAMASSYAEFSQLVRWKFSRPIPIKRHCKAFLPFVKTNSNLKNFIEGASIIICNRISYIEPLMDINVPVYLETHDIMCHTKSLRLWNEKGFKDSEEYEIMLSEKASLIGCFTERDKEFYEQQRKVPVINSPIALPSFSKITSRKTPPTKIKKLIYFGDNHPQNVFGIEQALKFLPSQFEVSLVGNICRHFESKSISSNIKLVGFVNDLRKEISKHDAIIVPDYAGTGISIKMIESLSYGVPVYFTENATRGLSAALNLPECCIANRFPSDFFSSLAEREKEILSVDWLEIRKSVMREYSDAKARQWAEQISGILTDR